MDMYQKRKMREEKKNNNQEEKLTKVGINWYPGHMAKTKREIAEDLKLIDVVIEILDSRIPISSQNPDIAELTKGKKKIIILNKTDLSDSKQNNLWIEYFNKRGQVAILADSNLGKGINEAIKAIENIMKVDLEEYAKKGRTGRKIRVMILGIPNVGKSSFINRIVKSNRLEVGNKPGVTRKKQWISINDKINLLDTPGVLWPKFQDEKVALNLAFTGTIKDDVLEQTEVGYQLLKFLLENYRDNLVERYNLSNTYIEDVLAQDQPENFNIYEIMLEIGKKRGAIVSGGNVDDEKTAKILIEDFRSGKLGKITIERI
jgi:ribosome biogenesis GTPase A